MKKIFLKLYKLCEKSVKIRVLRFFPSKTYYWHGHSSTKPPFFKKICTQTFLVRILSLHMMLGEVQKLGNLLKCKSCALAPCRRDKGRQQQFDWKMAGVSAR